MGLDMYLTKETYLGAGHEINGVRGTVDITKHGKPVPINFNRLDTITEEVGYWRKANHIHNWFVQNVQDGRDECQKKLCFKRKVRRIT